ncbi:MAG: hypothetical protein GYB67_10395, partial [Chloroflexi bacterium]|nr:hypothetical protein [Chloroflexota bacterium]
MDLNRALNVLEQIRQQAAPGTAAELNDVISLLAQIGESDPNDPQQAVNLLFADLDLGVVAPQAELRPARWARRRMESEPRFDDADAHESADAESTLGGVDTFMFDEDDLVTSPVDEIVFGDHGAVFDPADPFDEYDDPFADDQAAADDPPPPAVDPAVEAVLSQIDTGSTPPPASANDDLVGFGVPAEDTYSFEDIMRIVSGEPTDPTVETVEAPAAQMGTDNWGDDEANDAGSFESVLQMMNADDANDPASSGFGADYNWDQVATSDTYDFGAPPPDPDADYADAASANTLGGPDFAQVLQMVEPEPEPPDSAFTDAGAANSLADVLGLNDPDLYTPQHDPPAETAGNGGFDAAALFGDSAEAYAQVEASEDDSYAAAYADSYETMHYDMNAILGMTPPPPSEPDYERAETHVFEDDAPPLDPQPNADSAEAGWSYQDVIADQTRKDGTDKLSDPDGGVVSDKAWMNFDEMPPQTPLANPKTLDEILSEETYAATDDLDAFDDQIEQPTAAPPPADTPNEFAHQFDDSSPVRGGSGVYDTLPFGDNLADHDTAAAHSLWDDDDHFERPDSAPLQADTNNLSEFDP